jgi:hypothetical protein
MSPDDIPVHHRNAAWKKDATPEMEMRHFIHMKIAFVLLVLCLGWAPTQFASARTRGVIDDPDGFTNVRTAPRENAAIVARVKAGEIFEYDGTQKEAWWKVTLASGKTGWMHSSRIRMFVVLEDLVVAENDEANMYARAHGVDYRKAMRGAAKGDPAAMRQFFGVNCDGAACDTHLGFLLKVIHILGDEKLAKFLGLQSPSFQKELAKLITLNNEMDLEPFEQISYMKRHFPKTARLLYPR